MSPGAAIRRSLIFAAVIYLSWLAMQAVHELGHVLAAKATGGTVARVVIHPLAISRTDLSSNPAPTAVAWGGPLAGVMLPLLAAGGVRLRRARFGRETNDGHVERRWKVVQALADYFAGLCLIANGTYIGIGSFGGVGDAGDLLRQGAPPWLLRTFGAVCSATGLWIWHLATRRPSARPAVEKNE
jgi:hypothetical protein